MSIIERLTEGMVKRDMAKEGQALLEKWNATGLLEGIEDERGQHNMARLLENQAKELLREASSMAAGDVEGFAAVAFPIVRRVFAGLIANDLVSVQPMSLPSGLIFFLDFVFSSDIGDGGTLSDNLGVDMGVERFGNKASGSIYGTDRVGSAVNLGVDLLSANKADLGGPRTSVGYAYSSPTASVTITDLSTVASTHFGAAAIDFANDFTDAKKKLLDYDPDLLSLSGSYQAIIMHIKLSALVNDVAQADLRNMGAFVIDHITGSNIGEYGKDLRQIRRLTKFLPDDSHTDATPSGYLKFVMLGTGSANASVTSGSAIGVAANKIGFVYPTRDKLQAGNALGAVAATADWGLENSKLIPEIDIKVDSIAITAQTKKLKAKWTPELGQDLNAYHNLDAEVELTSILSEQIALEIDREILADLIRGANAATYYWSRSPGLFVDRTNGTELGAASAAPDFTGTVSEWYETLIETINDVSAQIHRKTLRGGANYVVVSPEVANILEFTAGFRANVTADADKGEIGAVKVGSLSRKFDVIVDPYFPRNAILVGRKGGSFLESGYVYAPYVPLQTTPTIFGVEDFVPRKGVMTRYAKKMVRPDMYGMVIVRGLLGEEGSS